MGEKFCVYRLQDHKELLEQCCELLNTEWKRSCTARLHGLERNCDTLPCSLMLVEKEGDEIKVVGHSRLSRFQDDTQGCLITSVLIAAELRGKGLGKYLMDKTEEFAKSLGYKTAYLSTFDKQTFYEHLGYDYHHNAASISFVSSVNPTQNEELMPLNMRINTKDNALPPPPPPLPPLSKKDSNAPVLRRQVWMKKKLHV